MAAIGDDRPFNRHNIVAKDHGIFLYSPDLKDAANGLALALGADEFFEFWKDEDLKKAKDRRFKVVWLVGHGLEKSSSMLDESGQEVVHIRDICAWCEESGTEALVDTACYPFRRKEEVAAHRRSFDYYCTQELFEEVQQIGEIGKITEYADLEIWWGKHGMGKVVPARR